MKFDGSQEKNHISPSSLVQEETLYTSTVWNSHIDEQLFSVIHEVKDLPTFITKLLHRLCNKAMRAYINGIVSITMEIFFKNFKSVHHVLCF